MNVAADAGEYRGNYSVTELDLREVNEHEYRQLQQRRRECLDRAICDATARRMVREWATRAGLPDPFSDLSPSPEDES